MAEVVVKPKFFNPQPDDAGADTYTKPKHWNEPRLFADGGADGDLVTWDPAASTKASYRALVAGSGISVVVAAGTITVSTTVSAIGGTGTANKLPKWTAPSTLGDSLLTEAGGTLTVAENLVVTTAGPHAFGDGPFTNAQVFIGGTYGGVGSPLTGLNVSPTLNPQANAPSATLHVQGVINKAGSGTHATFASARFLAPTIGAGAAAITQAATVLIDGQPTGGVENFALLISSGSFYFAGAEPSSIGGPASPPDPGVKLTVSGAFNPVSGNPNAGMYVNTEIFGLVNASIHTVKIQGELHEAASGTHPFIDCLYVAAPIETPGAATTTAATTLRVDGAPTFGTTNRSLWVQAGSVEFTGVGPHSIGGAFNARFQLLMTGTLPFVDNPAALNINTIVQANSSSTTRGAVLQLGGTVQTQAAAFTMADAMALYVPVPTLIVGAGSTITNASTVKIDGAPTGATNNRALWVAGGSVEFTATGPHAIGGTPDPRFQFFVTGTHTSSGLVHAFQFGSTLVPAAGFSARALNVDVTINEAASGTHPIFAGMEFGLVVTAGTATVTDVIGLHVRQVSAAAGTTNATGIKILAAPTGATNNRSLWVVGGLAELDGDVALFGAGSFGGGSLVMFVGNATTVPTTNPTAGGILYSEAGAGKWRGSSGTVTTFGPAEPHCPSCGRDFMHEWENERLGYLAVCMWCLTAEIGDRPWIVRR